jgi:hypothetical protein
MDDRKWFGCLRGRQPMNVLFAIERASDEYWCELREDAGSQVVAYIFKNGRPIRGRALVNHSAAVSWGIAEYAAISHNVSTYIAVPPQSANGFLRL